MPTPEAMSPREAPDADELLGAPDWRRWRASMNWMRSAGSRLRSMFASSASARRTSPAPIALVSSKTACSRVSATRSSTSATAIGPIAADVDRQLLQRLRQAAEVGAGQRRQRRGGVGLQRDLARARFGAQPAGERLIAQAARTRAGSRACAAPERAQPDVDLVADQQQARRRVGILEVGDQRLEVGGLHLVDRLADDQAALGHHGQRARGRDRRADAALLQIEDVVVERGAGARGGEHGRADGGGGGVDQVALARQAVDRLDVAARDRGGDVDLGLLRRPGHHVPCTTIAPA